MHVDATCERTRDAGSTPATSTILPSVYRASGDITQLLPDYCPHFDGRFEYPAGSGIHISKKQNRCLKSSYGFSYLVEVPGRLTGRGRVRRQFKSIAQAAGFAQLTVEGQKKMGQMFHQLSYRRLLEIGLEASTDSKEQGKKTKHLAEVAGELVAIKSQLYKNRTIRQRTYKSFAIQMHLIVRQFGKHKIDCISTSSITSWLELMQRSQRTKQNYLNALKELMKFAVARGYTENSPTDAITPNELKQILGRKKESEPSILTVIDAKKLLLCAQKNSQLGLLASVTLGLFCGLRTEEIKRLDWSSVQLERRILTASPSVAKKRRIRTVTIPENAAILLKQISKDKGPVAPNNYSSQFQKNFYKLIQSSGLHWKTNAMRHSFGSYHYALLGDSVATSREMGHKNGDDILFSYYRALVSSEDAIQYFNIGIK